MAAPVARAASPPASSISELHQAVVKEEAEEKKKREEATTATLAYLATVPTGHLPGIKMGATSRGDTLTAELVQRVLQAREREETVKEQDQPPAAQSPPLPATMGGPQFAATTPAASVSLAPSAPPTMAVAPMMATTPLAHTSSLSMPAITTTAPLHASSLFYEQGQGVAMARPAVRGYGTLTITQPSPPPQGVELVPHQPLGYGPNVMPSPVPFPSPAYYAEPPPTFQQYDAYSRHHQNPYRGPWHRVDSREYRG